LPQRIGEEKASRGKPLETPYMRAKTVARQPCFCEVEHIQILRSHFDGKCEHGRRTQQAKARIFDICDAPLPAQISNKTK
jgi:hypothetical protein